MKMVTKILSLAAATLGIAVVPQPSFAGNVYNTTITAIIGTNYGGTGAVQPVFIVVSGQDSNIGCNSGSLNEFAIDVGTPGGRAMLTLALTAQATGQLVNVFGGGNCSVWFALETVSSLQLN